MKKKIKKYEKGRRFEYKVKKFYEHLGYYVIRSASSKGLFDLIAFNQEEFKLIQCKTFSKIPEKEIKLLKEIEVPFNCEKLIVFKKEKQILFQKV